VSIAQGTFGKITEVNDAALKLFGYSKHEIIGRDHSMIIPRAMTRAAHHSVLARFNVDGIARVTQNARLVFCAHRDGVMLPISADIRSMDGCLGFACQLLKVNQSFVWFGGVETGWAITSATTSALSLLQKDTAFLRSGASMASLFKPGSLAVFAERAATASKRTGGCAMSAAPNSSDAACTDDNADWIDTDLLVSTGVDLLSDSVAARVPIPVHMRLQVLSYASLGGLQYIARISTSRPSGARGAAQSTSIANANADLLRLEANNAGDGGDVTPAATDTSETVDAAHVGDRRRRNRPDAGPHATAGAGVGLAGATTHPEVPTLLARGRRNGAGDGAATPASVSSGSGSSRVTTAARTLRAAVLSKRATLESTLRRMRLALLIVVAAISLLNLGVSVFSGSTVRSQGGFCSHLLFHFRPLRAGRCIHGEQSRAVIERSSSHR
jgi:PAS domain S-box-containing protein